MQSRIWLALSTIMLAPNTLANSEVRHHYRHTCQDDASDQEANRKRQIDRALSAQVRDILERSSQLVIFSLSPVLETGGGGDLFHQWKIRGRTILADPKTKVALLESFYDGIANAHGMAKCFNPQHGIRAVSDGKIVDLVLCFHCRQFLVYLDNRLDGRPHPLTDAPQALLDHILSDAHIPANPKK